jgi:DNA mismatch repair ATPase MutS
MDCAMRRLIKEEYKVALCDPLEIPQKAKGVSNRDVNK